jgi:hypothetical protein
MCAWVCGRTGARASAGERAWACECTGRQAGAGVQAGAYVRVRARAYGCTHGCACAHVRAREHGLILPTLLYINPLPSVSEPVCVRAPRIWRAHNAHVR